MSAKLKELYTSLDAIPKVVFDIYRLDDVLCFFLQ